MQTLYYVIHRVFIPTHPEIVVIYSQFFLSLLSVHIYINGLFMFLPSFLFIEKQPEEESHNDHIIEEDRSLFFLVKHITWL